MFISVNVNWLFKEKSLNIFNKKLYIFQVIENYIVLD